MIVGLIRALEILEEEQLGNYEEELLMEDLILRLKEEIKKHTSE